MKFAPGFEDYHRGLLGAEFDDFVGALGSHSLRSSVRVNTLKASREKVEGILSEGGIDFGGVPWCDDGLFVSVENRLPELEHKLGFFFVQDAGSMLAPVLLGTGEGDSVLDLCAAPGGKSTHVAQLMRNTGFLVANEPNYKRLSALVFSLQRCGVSNAVVAKFDGCGFHELGLSFDRVLVDAPCSGVGTAFRNRGVLGDWSLSRVKRFSGLQKKLVESAYRCLRPGGVLVYVTCTTSLEENEEVIEHLLDCFGGASIVRERPNGLVFRRGLTARTRLCLRVYPHLTGTGSYFFAKVLKDG